MKNKTNDNSVRSSVLSPILSLALALLTLTACTNGQFGSTGSSNVAAQAAPVGEGINVAPATITQCSAGGNVYSIFMDLNANGVMDSNEIVLSSQVVCNGTNGVNGISTLFSMAHVTTDTSVCASGTGVQVSSGLDTNRSGILDNSEITQTQVLCDGATGATGATGAGGSAGSNGHSVVFQTTAAIPNDCPAGGSTIMMALDVNDAGFYSALDPNQQSVTLCNGMNGTNGTNGQDAPVPAYTPVEPIMPCGNTVAYKEVLLRLSNGQVLGAFSNDVSGYMTRLAFLPDGSFIDTDTSGCNFTLSTSSDGSTRAISWAGQVQESWPITN